MAQHNDTGTFGETVAANLMTQKGYRVVERNWKTGNLEVDIIATNRDTIVFVEVKTRSTHFGGKEPEEFVDRNKQFNISHAAHAYVKQHAIQLQVRFDIVAIVANPVSHEIEQIRHVENAFYPPMRTVSSGTGNPERRWHSKIAWKRRGL